MIELVMMGGGKMGEALLGGLLRAGWASAEQLAVVEKLPARAEELSRLFPGVTVAEEPVAAPAAVLAVKPNDIAGACAALAALGDGGPRRVLSIAAGVTLATLEAALAPGTAVVRAMPNTPALVGQGAAAIAAGSAAAAADLAWAESILAAVGRVVTVTEGQLDAVTGLSGSGPAYVFLVVEALADGGVAAGLPRAIAQQLALQTVLGTTTLMKESGLHPAVLKDQVTSPGGTTIAGVAELEARGLRSALIEAVKAAKNRSVELGR